MVIEKQQIWPPNYKMNVDKKKKTIELNGKNTNEFTLLHLPFLFKMSTFL